VAHAQEPHIAAIKNMVARNAAVSKMWHEIKEERERWCARRGRIVGYLDFVRHNKAYAKEGNWNNMKMLWVRYKETWDALTGMCLSKRSVGSAALAAASAAAHHDDEDDSSDDDDGGVEEEEADEA
jgi:hypothetical protein